jgi:hypothetical protein
MPLAALVLPRPTAVLLLLIIRCRGDRLRKALATPTLEYDLTLFLLHNGLLLGVRFIFLSDLGETEDVSLLTFLGGGLCLSLWGRLI